MRKGYILILAVLISFTAIGVVAHTLKECDDELVDKTVYYGTASCSVKHSHGTHTISRQIDSSDYQKVTLTKNFKVSDSQGSYWEKVTCVGTLPYSRTEQVVEEVCHNVSHRHDLVAVADVFDDEMDVFVNNCNWGGWSGHTNSRINTLYCDGKSAVAVTEQLGQQEHFCSVSIFNDDYIRKYPGSKTCLITILKADYTIVE